MRDNRQLFRDLLSEGRIAIEPAAFFDRDPDPPAVEGLFPKVEGMLLGLAIGDSLGNTSESLVPADRRQRHGEITHYLPNRHADGRAIGLPSDDTQLAFWLLEHLLEYDGLVPSILADTYCKRQIFGLGGTVREFLRRHKDRGIPWYESGVASAGNGALMRIAPILIPHLRQPTSALWADTVLATFFTHNDRGSTAACVAYVHLLWNLLSMKTPPPRGWWLETFCRVARELEGPGHYKPRNENTPFPFEGSIADFAEMAVSTALKRGWSTVEACDRWYSGAFLLETVPCVLYILERHGDDPREAIIRAVNDTRDNDTIAAIVGAAVGALHGSGALPRPWVENLSGRTTATDDGYIFTLIEQARKRFLPD